MNIELNKIYHEDAIEILENFPSNFVDLIFTSPPYYKNRTYTENDFINKKSGVSSSKLDIIFEDYKEFIKTTMMHLHRVLKDGGIIAWNIGASREKDLPSYSSVWLDKVGFQYQDTIIWYKMGGGGIRVKNISNLKYYPAFSHERIFIYRKGDVMKNTFDKKDLPKIKGWKLMDTWFVRSVQSIKEIGHPAPFPVKLAEMVVMLYSKTGDIILDPFIGSETTAVACKKLRRNFIGIEINLQYIELANKRILNTPIVNTIKDYF